MSDTPETNSRAWSDHSEGILHEVVEANFARKLERERDEAREALADWENAAAHVEADHPDEKHCGCVPVLRKLLTDALKDRDEWAAMCGRYKQERDEAQESLKHITEYGTEEINAAVELRQKLATALVERDEWKNKAYSHATDYTLMEAKCFRLEQELKEYDKLKS
jgi:hypothetical protein